MRLKLISCDMFEREVKAAAARSINHIDLEFLSKPPHQLTDRDKVECVQASIDRAKRAQYHAVLLVAGSCKDGMAGLAAGPIPLVLPRVRDCISLLVERRKVFEKPLVQPQATATADSRRSSCSRSTLSQWQTAVSRPKLQPARALRSHGMNTSWAWRDRFSTRTSCPGAAHARPTCSILDMLVNGYWNYTDFLVVAPYCRVVVDDAGSIAAEE